MRIRSWIPLLCLFLATPLAAWGPFTHCVVNQLALEELKTKPGFGFLSTPEHGAIFVRAGSAADLVFSLKAGGKTDPAYNNVLHEAAFHAHLYTRCRDAGDLPCQAFALGLRAHLAGDEVGNADTSPSARNSFDWPTESDVFGRAVTDAARSAAARLRGVTIGLNKIMIDGLVRRERRSGQDYSPYVDEAALVGALETYQGPHAVPNGSAAEKAAIAEKVRAFSRSFKRSFGLLQLVNRRFWDNRRLREPLTEEFGGAGRDLPAVSPSATHAVTSLEAMRAGRPAPAARITGCLQDLDPEALSEMGGSLAGALEEHSGAETPAGDLEFLRGAEATALPRPDYASLEEADRAALSDLKRRVMQTFLVNAVVPFRRWTVLERRVRGLVPYDPRGFRARVKSRTRAILREIPDLEDLRRFGGR